MQRYVPIRNNATSIPDNARAIGDLGPGRIQGGAVSISEQTLSALVAGGDSDTQLAAESIRTQVKSAANFTPYPFTINPPASLGGVHPATVVVVSQQILGGNPSRKSFFYQELQSSNRGSNGVTQSGVLLQPGPSSQTASNGTQASSLLNNIVQTSYLSVGGSIGIDGPAPTNPVTVVAQWGPPAVAGTPITPLSGVIYEGA
jgi:hypothetical protein